MTDFPDGDPDYWAKQAVSIDDARRAVWAVPKEEWASTTSACVRVLLDRLPESPRWFLDVGTGIGRLAVPLLLRYPNADLVALDVSDRMLDLARNEADRAGVKPRFHPVVDPVGNGAVVADRGFDAVFTVAVLQHLAATPATELVARVASTLVPGGALVAQTVTDAEPGRLELYQLEAALVRAGLRLDRVEPGLVFDCWTWVTASRSRGS